MGEVNDDDEESDEGDLWGARARVDLDFGTKEERKTKKEGAGKWHAMTIVTGPGGRLGQGVVHDERPRERCQTWTVLK